MAQLKTGTTIAGNVAYHAGNHASTGSSHGVATGAINGFMSSTDKTKLDGIATGATNYTHPTTTGNKHVPSGGSSGQILGWSADGTAAWVAAASAAAWGSITGTLASQTDLQNALNAKVAANDPALKKLDYCTQSGTSANAMGTQCTSSGDYSLAVGNYAVASGDQATAIGLGTLAQGRDQLVIGHYNVGNGSKTTYDGYLDYAFIIGNGTSPVARANALTVAWDGQITTTTTRAPLVVSSTLACTNLNADLLDGQHGSYYAPLASPALTGTPTAPTAAAGTNTTQIATTAFVVGQAGTATPIVEGTGTVGTSLRYAREDHVHPAAPAGGLIIQATAPTGDATKLWINTTTNVASYWSGTAWVDLVGVWG